MSIRKCFFWERLPGALFCRFFRVFCGYFSGQLIRRRVFLVSFLFFFGGPISECFFLVSFLFFFGGHILDCFFLFLLYFFVYFLYVFCIFLFFFPSFFNRKDKSLDPPRTVEKYPKKNRRKTRQSTRQSENTCEAPMPQFARNPAKCESHHRGPAGASPQFTQAFQGPARPLENFATPGWGLGSIFWLFTSSWRL